MSQILSRRALEAAIRRAELQGARMEAGAQFGSRTERVEAGRLLRELAEVARRCFDPPSARAWADSLPPSDPA